jgi:capsular exopolysaccharide synthesis family protein
LSGSTCEAPKAWGEFGLNENSRGISTYLIGRDSINEILYKSKSDNLWIIPSGPVPPNPSELASSAKTEELFSELKKMFDYIIVDSALLGMVSDTYPLAVIADITLIVVRYNKTIKEALKITLTDAKATGITGMSLLLNDIYRSKSLYGYSGRYLYGENLKK